MVYKIPESNNIDREYFKIIAKVLTNGEYKQDRTGVGTKSIFGYQVQFNLQEGFPLLTSKKVHTKSIIHELLWFLSGDTNIKYLKDNGVTIWDEWANADGDLGSVYGKQWRRWDTGKQGNFIITDRAPNGEACDGYCPKITIDQITALIDGIKNNPHSRRHIVNAWNVGELDEMALPPCHMFFQCYIRNNKFIDLHLYQRSVDVALGLPFNWASYAFLLHMIAQQTGYEVGNFIHSMGDVHIYNNHIEKITEQIHQKTFDLPTISINKADDIFSYKYEDFVIHNYQSSPSIKFDIAV